MYLIITILFERCEDKVAVYYGSLKLSCLCVSELMTEKTCVSI